MSILATFSLEPLEYLLFPDVWVREIKGIVNVRVSPRNLVLQLKCCIAFAILNLNALSRVLNAILSPKICLLK